MTGKRNLNGITSLLALLAMAESMNKQAAQVSGIGTRTAGEAAAAKEGRPGATFSNDAIEKIMAGVFGVGPCDDPNCPVCRQDGKDQPGETGADSSGTTQVRAVIAIAGEVAAMVGLTPSMLEDDSEAPTTRLRMATAEFVTALRSAYESKVETSSIHRTLADSMEVQVLNAMEAALAGLDD